MRIAEAFSGRRGFWLLSTAAAALYSTAAASTPLANPFRKYAAAAEGWLSGSLPVERLLDFSPLYLALSVALERWTPAPEKILEWLQILLAAWTVGALFLLLRRRFGEPLAALAAGALALDRHILIYQRILEPETLLLALVVGLLLLIDRPSAAASLSAGLLAAACLATRPTFLPIFLVMPLYFRGRQDIDEPAAISWRRRSVLFCLPVAISVLVLSWHAWRASGSWRTPVMNPGTVFFEGNQPLSRGTSAVYPPLVLAMARHSGDRPDTAHEHYREVIRATEPDAEPNLVNQRWLERARAHLLDSPTQTLRRLSTKLAYAFHGFRWHDVPAAWRLDQRLIWPSVPFFAVSALALIGLLSEARSWRRALPFYVLAGMQLAVMTVFYVSTRQRLVMLPAFLYFALCGWQAIRNAERRWPPALLAGLLALTFALPDHAIRDESYVQKRYVTTGALIASLHSEGIPLAQKRASVVETMASAPWWIDGLRPAWVPQEDATLDELVAARLEQQLHEVPSFEHASARFDVGHAWLRADRPEAAIHWLGPLVEEGFRAYRGGRQPSDPRVLLARAEASRGRLEAARQWLEQALDDEPGDPFALAELAALGDAPWAVDRLDRYFGEPDRRWLLGRALRRQGRAAEAIEQLAPLANDLPQLREAHLYLALALGDAGRIDEAASAILTANRQRSEPVLDVRAMASIARRWADAHAQDPKIQLLAALLLHQHGAFAEARDLLARLRRLPDLPPELLASAEELESRLRPALAESPADRK